MSAWNNFTTLYNGTIPGTVNLNWSPVPEMSDLDIQRLGVNAGIRYRGEKGYGLEFNISITDYTDDDPILEDESGTFSRYTVMFSRLY